MAMVEKLLLAAEASLPTKQWRQDVLDLIEAAPDWFELAAKEVGELWVRIKPNGRILKIKARANLKALLSADEQHGPLGALFVLALANKLGAEVFDAENKLVPFRPYNPSAAWLAGSDENQVAAVSEALGVKPPGPKFKTGKQPLRLFSFQSP